MNEYCGSFCYLKSFTITFILDLQGSSLRYMFEENTCVLGTFMSDEKNNTGKNATSTQSEPIKTEVKLLQKLTELVTEYHDYESPRIRSDGDIIIPLNSELKRNRQAFQSLADAVQLMMDRDKPKRYR
tara:strand:- start:299 stop:682 length:384 start_codon:yes stop_codon:yes gene_type:complete